MADTTEHHIALREAHQVGASDSFFAARPELRDTEHERYIFDAGFRRGFDAHESLQRKATATPPADAALADDGIPDSVLLKAYTTMSGGEVLAHSWRPIFLRYARIGISAALRARAVPDGKRVLECYSEMAHGWHECARPDTCTNTKRTIVMLAASKEAK